MKIPVSWGCRILTSQYAYEMSLRQTFPNLGIELVDLREAVCCGDPIKSINTFAANYMAARILALTNLTGLADLLVPCSRCHFTISESKHRMETDEKLRFKIDELLNQENLEYDPNVKVWHVVDFLHDMIGLKKIKEMIKKPFRELKLATHVGCQVIRYTDLGRVDDAENPRKLDDLVSIFAMKPVEYSEKLDCCGAALDYSHQDAALSLAGSKVKALQDLHVDGLVVCCPSCQMMFDSKQKSCGEALGTKLNLPVLYYTQLLGLALGIEADRLGLHLNQSPVGDLLAKVST